MGLIEILFGTSILLLIVLIALILMLAFRPAPRRIVIRSTRSDLEKIKAQIK